MAMLPTISTATHRVMEMIEQRGRGSVGGMEG